MWKTKGDVNIANPIKNRALSFLDSSRLNDNPLTFIASLTIKYLVRNWQYHRIQGVYNRCDGSLTLKVNGVTIKK